VIVDFKTSSAVIYRASLLVGKSTAAHVWLCYAFEFGKSSVSWCTRVGHLHLQHGSVRQGHAESDYPGWSGTVSVPRGLSVVAK
jgi:hypothetical protein